MTIFSYSLSFPFESLHFLNITEASTLAGENVLGSFNKEITLKRIVLKTRYNSMKVDFCMTVFGSGSILVLKSIYSTETWGKIISWCIFVFKMPSAKVTYLQMEPFRYLPTPLATSSHWMMLRSMEGNLFQGRQEWPPD